MPGFLSPERGLPLLLIPEYSGINKEQRIPDRSKTAHWKPPVKCFLTGTVFCIFLFTCSNCTILFNLCNRCCVFFSLPNFCVSCHFSFFWPCRVPYGILVPWPGMEPTLSAVEAWSLNHRSSRDVLKCEFSLKWRKICLLQFGVLASWLNLWVIWFEGLFSCLGWADQGYWNSYFPLLYSPVSQDTCRRTSLRVLCGDLFLRISV